MTAGSHCRGDRSDHQENEHRQDQELFLHKQIFLHSFCSGLWLSDEWTVDSRFFCTENTSAGSVCNQDKRAKTDSLFSSAFYIDSLTDRKTAAVRTGCAHSRQLVVRDDELLSHVFSSIFFGRISKRFSRQGEKSGSPGRQNTAAGCLSIIKTNIEEFFCMHFENFFLAGTSGPGNRIAVLYSSCIFMLQ